LQYSLQAESAETITYTGKFISRMVLLILPNGTSGVMHSYEVLAIQKGINPCSLVFPVVEFKWQSNM